MEKYEEDVSISRRKFLKTGALLTASLAMGIIPVSGLLAQTTGDKDPQNSSHLGFKYDQRLCIGCKSCENACKDAYNWDKGVKWRRVLSGTNADAYLSISCNHCRKPACVKTCPVEAYSISEKDGIVLHDPGKCVGCKYCTYACPYHAPQFSEETGRVSKCHFCFEQQDRGKNKKPVCVANCPTGALTCANMNELRKTGGGVAELKGLPDADLTGPSWVIIPKA